MRVFRKIFRKLFTKKRNFYRKSPSSETQVYENLQQTYREIESKKEPFEEKKKQNRESIFRKLMQDLEFNREAIIKRQNEEKEIEQKKNKERKIRWMLGDVGELKEKQSYTERLLLKAMNKIGLFPEEQYLISDMSVDFAFPDEKLIIEVDGPYHEDEGQRLTDIKRGYVLRDYGWSIWRLKAEKVYNNPIKMAYRVKFILEKRRNP